MLLAEKGQVLGIDVGYSDSKKTTGFCVLSWNREAIDWKLKNTGKDDGSRQQAIHDLLSNGSQDVLAVAIDGPLRPQLQYNPTSCRIAERLLMRGKFQNRGKPGATNSGSGPNLHYEATRLANFTLEQVSVVLATHIPIIHKQAVVEAFPNLFLGVLCNEADYPLRPQKKRKWTDTLYPKLEGKLQGLLMSLLPGRKINGDWNVEKDHEKTAGLICALTALCVTAQRFVAIGSEDDGYIILPPHDSWGYGISTSEPWAERELRLNIKSVARDFRQSVVYRNNETWIK